MSVRKSYCDSLVDFKNYLNMGVESFSEHLFLLLWWGSGEHGGGELVGGGLLGLRRRLVLGL